ncbi:response regulator [Ammoniphilus sp. YIM 78166]|uniref:response regulator transcription factor n=1 Tax=Ammoniphilus sp. YIM 78166 TaxID=1644106 RepID=UPI00106FA8FE|nr:response regulator [Ammoniphilus sp. YIM 78166]
MKVLVVDDEQHVREAIRLLGNWDKYGIEVILEASHGEEAISLILEHRPEIVFSDVKMPKMDGLQLLEWMKEKHPTGKTIIVTGYDDYQYMRKAIHCGSADYLLKPVDPEVLNQTLDEAVQAWEREEAERKEKKSSSQFINEMKPIYRDRILTKILDQVHSEDLDYQALNLPPSAAYQTALVKINGDHELDYFSALNVMNEMAGSKNCGMGFRYLSAKGEIVVVLWDRLDDTKQLLIHMYHSLKKVLGVSCPMALGKPVDGLMSLTKSYQKAKEVLLSQNILKKESVRVYSQEEGTKEPLINLLSYSTSIELAIQAGEIEAFKELMKRITKEFQDRSFLSLNQLHHLEKEYAIIGNRFFKTYHIPYSMSDELEKRIDCFFDQNGTFQLEKYMERKKREISLLLRMVKRYSPSKKANVIYEIEQYLQANFNRDVKLQEISDHFYLSREYISRKFKQEFNENISDYIIKIRMAKAKSLLKNSELKIYDIANMIGYQDDKYFRKVFKKVEGITPNEYRSSHT